MIALWGRLLTGGRELEPSRIEVDDDRIVSIRPSSRPLPGDVTVEDGWIAPGLIDLQVNGAGGADLTSAADPARALESVARTLAEHGVTSFCPTIVSSPEDVVVERIRAFAPRKIPRAAECLGIHVEGPFIDCDHRGVHDPHALREASFQEIERWLAAGTPRIVTLAPEQPSALAAIEQLTAAGVLVSLGHSGAMADAAQAGLAAGARCATHLFNGMPPLHHREPGLVGAVLASDIAFGVIGDGVHLHPLTLDLVVRCAGPGRVVLVSDALAPAAAEPGSSVLGYQSIVSDGVSVRRTDGTLAGSAVLVDGCLRNARAWLPWLPPAQVLRMATQTPADLLGLARKGRIEPGADADLTVFDADWQVRMTFVGGEAIASRVALT